MMQSLAEENATADQSCGVAKSVELSVGR